MDREGDEQQTQRRREMVETHSGDGERRNADQAENPQPSGGDNDQRSVQGDPGRPCEPRFDLQELLKELEREQLGSSIIERAFYPAPLSVPPREREAEYRAWEQLQFASLLPVAGFDEELAASGWYSAVYREHSDRGLAEIEAKEKPPSAELAAFKQLEQMGVYDQTVFYSPAKAQQSHYTNELSKTLSGRGTKRNQRGSGKAAVEVEKYRRRRHKEG
jgi:hypothetical protein